MCLNSFRTEVTGTSADIVGFTQTEGYLIMGMFSHPIKDQAASAPGKPPEIDFSAVGEQVIPPIRRSGTGGGFSHLIEVPEDQKGVIIRRPRIR